MEQAFPSVLEWRQPSGWRYAFELVDGEEIVATLRWKSSWTSSAEGEFREQCWTFKRQGFLRPCITLRRQGSDENIGAYQPSWLGAGVLTTISGRTFEWAHEGFWKAQYTLFQRNVGPVFRIIPGSSGLFKMSASVEIQPEFAGDPDTPMLVLFGWYLLVLSNQEAAAIGATTAVTVAS